MFKNRIRQAYQIVRWIAMILTIISIGWLIYDIGFRHPEFHVMATIYQLYLVTFIFNIVAVLFRYVFSWFRPPRKLWVFDGIFLMSILGILYFAIFPEEIQSSFIDSQEAWIWIFVTLIWGFIRELFTTNIHHAFLEYNPAQLFAGSFLVLIVFGTLALMLPNATYEPISFVNALFTATSAVCVTGLIVMDTGKDFTPFGQGLILLLIQLGGLGIMTFTSFFSLFFRGKTSFKNQLLIREITNSGRLTEVYSMVKTIIIYSVGFELMGAILVFLSIDGGGLEDIFSMTFFSIFHSVSAFCNAGFSTMSENLYGPVLRFNYPLQIILAWLIIFGGLGFPIVFNFIQYVRYYIFSTFTSLRKKTPFIHKPRMININTRIVLITTGILLVAGTVLFFIFEYNNSLAEHSLWGKWVVSFFSGTTPRTAGFNSVDFADVHLHTTMVIIMLMWIGASPMSTGGGVKTTTFALAILNITQLVQGKERIEIFRRQISDRSVRRAFGVIFLSLAVIGFSTLFIRIFDPETDNISTLFEVVSAYSTVGLSMGITAGLSVGSKLVLIATMFLGRVTMFTILVAIFRRIQNLNYQYPEEDIMIT